ncbi:MAG: CHAT domain-containing protein [Deltaproteobacteria bacterium]|nr:CHAT domain-containing protein [Deltaproteobacteria bacterium]
MGFAKKRSAQADKVTSGTDIKHRWVGNLKEASTVLYRQLIQPIISEIGGKELIIVPHDVLHYLPFQALIDPKGKFLTEIYPISYLSSASLLQFTKEKRKAHGEKALAFGNPDLDDPEKDLAYAELEAQEHRNLRRSIPNPTCSYEKMQRRKRARLFRPTTTSFTSQHTRN